MSALDEAINRLSPQDMDLLDKDPQLMADFKTKYGGPQPSIMRVLPKVAGVVYGDQMKEGLQDIGQNIAGVAGALKTGAYDIPKALLTDPMSIPQKVTEAGEGLEQGAENFSASDAVKYVTSHPFTTASLFAGLGGEAGPESVVKGFSDEIASTSNDRLASMNKKLANITENATKMRGYEEPVPSKEDLNVGTKNVIQAYKDVIDQHGKVLNAAKTEAGLPATKDEIDFSTRRYGNQFGLNVNKPLDLPADMPVTRPLQPGDKITVNHADLPEQELTYRGPMAQDSPEALKNMGVSDELAAKMRQPFYDLSADIPGHPAKSSLSHESLKDLGYQLPEEMSNKPMQYQIGDHDTPEQLNTEINRFKANLKYIHNSDKIKAASYFQDQIQQQGVFKTDIAKGPVMGRLKGQYGDLADMISDTSPTLQDAKSKFSKVLNSLDKVSDKLDPERPGASQSYLKRLFTSGSASAQDDLRQLAYLEKLSGKPIVTELFKKFAGEAFGPLVSERGARLMTRSLPYALGGAALGHAGMGLALEGMEAATTSPRLIGALESGAGKAADVASSVGPAAALQSTRAGLQRPFNTPDLQSLRDRLRNEQ